MTAWSSLDIPQDGYFVVTAILAGDPNPEHSVGDVVRGRIIADMGDGYVHLLDVNWAGPGDGTYCRLRPATEAEEAACRLK